MRATAAQSVRVEKPVYHIALSFDPEDGVDRATMVRVADRLLSDLDLREHQALIVAHGDTHHAHVYLIVRHASELQAVPPEKLETLLKLPERLDAAAERTSRVVDETIGRTTATLQETFVQTIDRGTRRLMRATRRMAKQQRALTGTERNLAYAIERLRRQADRIGWLETGVIVLALIAGTLGGFAAALVILSWTQ